MPAPEKHTAAEIAEIEELCRLADKASMAAEYVKNNTPVATIRAELVHTAFRPLCDAVREVAISAGLADFADHIALRAASVEDGAARIADAKEIVYLCTTIARRPDDAKDLILSGKSVAQARVALINAMAEADVHTDSTRPTPAHPLNEMARKAYAKGGK